MRRVPLLAVTLALAAAVLAACGGGGGGGGATGAPPPTTPPTATPTPTVAPTPSSVQYTGRVVDADHGNAAVSGAAISVGTSFVYAGSGYVLGGVNGNATSAADGSFTIVVPTGALYLQVTKSGLVDLHRPIPSAPSTSFGTLALPTATSEDLSGLAALNADRAKYGSGAGSQPLTLDADLELTARAVTQNEATLGYYAHVQPGTSYSYSVHYICTVLTGGFCANPYFLQENLDTGQPSQANAELAYVGLGPADGHYQNVISKTNLWVGFGETLNGKPNQTSGPGATSDNYFADEFFTSTANPTP